MGGERTPVNGEYLMTATLAGGISAGLKHEVTT
jgi:hypothetical protein